MEFIRKIKEENKKRKTWFATLDDAVERNDSRLLIDMLSNRDFEDGYDDILYRLGNFDDQKIIDLLFDYAINSKEVELRDSAIKALLDIADRKNEIYDKLTIILESELNNSNPNEDILDIYLYRMLFEELPVNITNIFFDKFLTIIDEAKLPKGNLKNLIAIIGNLNKTKHLPFILKKKQNEYFKNTVNNALKKIGYKQIIKLIEIEKDSLVKKMAIDEFSYIRINCKYNERVKDWDITEEEALEVLIKALKDSNKSVQISTIRSIGCYGEFALEAVTELEPFLQNEEKILRIVTEKAIKQIISQDKVESESLIEHYESFKTKDEKKSLFEFNRTNMYLITMILSIIMNFGLIVNQFFILNTQAKQIIGFIIFGFLAFIILFLLGMAFYNWNIKTKKKKS
ncbi:MAG: HEAT repeat domain-containing protein [Candidatus Heimdallarchaeota archaeon]